MKKFSLIQPVLVAVLALVFHSAAFAHSALQQSVPANGQSVSSPSVMMLSFDGAVRLVRLSVTGSNGAVDMGFVPQAAANSTFHLPMPHLMAGTYQVNWTILGADGHSVSEDFSFTVDPNAPAAVMDHSHGDDHSHDHGQSHSHGGDDHVH